MAPEQARGARDADGRSDIWSMGVVLFHLLTGRVPHDDIDGLGELLITICSEPPPRLRDVAPWVPAEIDAIVDRALRLDPRERFQRADEMLEALFQLLPAGSAVTREMLFASSTPLPAAEEAPLTTRLDAATPANETMENKLQDASPAPARLVAAPVTPRPSPPPAHTSLGDSDQAVERSVPPRPAVPRRKLTAPLVLFAAAIVGGLVGVGMSRFHAGPRHALASDGRGATFTATAPLSPVEPAQPAAADAGADASAANARHVGGTEMP
jgi:serine/threonine-protein kinase